MPVTFPIFEKSACGQWVWIVQCFPQAGNLLKVVDPEERAQVGGGEYQESAGEQLWIHKLNNYCTRVQHSDRLSNQLCTLRIRKCFWMEAWFVQSICGEHWTHLTLTTLYVLLGRRSWWMYWAASFATLAGLQGSDSSGIAWHFEAGHLFACLLSVSQQPVSLG